MSSQTLRAIFALALPLLLALVFSLDSRAADKFWDNGGLTNFWNDNDNWSPDEKPQPADNAFVAGSPEVNTLEIFTDLTNGGMINIGDGTAILSQLNLAGGTLLTGSGHDQLASTGTVELAGSLDVSLLDLDNGYAPAAGDTFDIITSANNDIVGTFQFENLLEFGLGHQLKWQPIDYNDPRKVTLEIATAEVDTEDLNRDGFVDGLDLGILLGNWNQNVSPNEGGLNGEPPVDGLDLGILLGAWRPPSTLAKAQRHCCCLWPVV